MNRILIATDNESDIQSITSITVSDKKWVSVIYNDGRVVKYLYNPHFDKDSCGRPAYDRARREEDS